MAGFCYCCCFLLLLLFVVFCLFVCLFVCLFFVVVFFSMAGRNELVSKVCSKSHNKIFDKQDSRTNTPDYVDICVTHINL